MSRYVLDSTVLIESEGGVEPTSSRVKALVAADHELCVCAVVLAEFHSGAPRGTNPRMDAFLDRLNYVDLTPEMAATAGSFRHSARAQGRRLHTPDALIAALAHHLAATILTNNVRDFELTGVTIEQLGGAKQS
jgi:predicted nucleic acid-binding protein